MRSWRSDSEEATRAVGELLAGELEPDGVLLLEGALGAGKTVLVQGLARGLGIDPAEIQSPTFILVREHRGARTSLAHVDLYRLEPADAGALGLEELLAGPGVKAVEWAERLPFPVAAALRLEIRRGESAGERRIVERSGDAVPLVSRSTRPGERPGRPEERR